MNQEQRCTSDKGGLCWGRCWAELGAVEKITQGRVEPYNQVHIHLEALRKNHPPAEQWRQIEIPGCSREAAQAGALGEKGCILRVSIGLTV